MQSVRPETTRGIAERRSVCQERDWLKRKSRSTSLSTKTQASNIWNLAANNCRNQSFSARNIDICKCLRINDSCFRLVRHPFL